MSERNHMKKLEVAIILKEIEAKVLRGLIFQDRGWQEIGSHRAEMLSHKNQKVINLHFVLQRNQQGHLSWMNLLIKWLTKKMTTVSRTRV